MKKIAAITLIVISLVLGVSDSFADPSSLEKWCTDRMSLWSPPGKSMIQDAKETAIEARARYSEIVQDAISVVYDPSEEPLIKGPYGRAKTLAIMLAVADSESGFRKDVDKGKGGLSKGDNGKSWCLMQVQLSPAVNGKTTTRIALKGDLYEYVYDKSGWGGEDLVSNRKACFQAALHIMRLSFRSCGPLPVEEKLTVYTSGNCYDGRAASRKRVEKALKWLSEVAPPVNDADFMAPKKMSLKEPMNGSSLASKL